MSRAAALDQIRAIDEERSIDALASHVTQPDEHPPAESEPMPNASDPSAPDAPRWCRALAEVFGTDEPSDDDREDWIIRDLIPRGEPAIWAGPPKAGKTWGALDLALCAARGEPWLGGAFENTLGEPARVLVVALEDGKRRLWARTWELCRSRGVTPNDPTIAEHLMISRESLHMPGEERRFAAELQRVRPMLVIADCLTRIMVGNQNAIDDVARFTSIWSRMCSDVGASIVFLHHTAKIGDPSRARDFFELIRGSSDLLAAARNAIVSMPMEIDGAKVSEVRMRGNLDLRRDRFALGFERTQAPDGRWSARMVDRLDPEALIVDAKGSAKQRREADKRRDELHTMLDRRLLALETALRTGMISIARHSDCAKGAGFKCSESYAQRDLSALRGAGLLVFDARAGHTLTAAGRAVLAAPTAARRDALAAALGLPGGPP